ncbi:MAG: RNA methyltransferase [Tannerella sp.]|jgi:tRNA G18 (ribose-2'-O)-methylase SpoU|nr:RNA methyltransferase [Tannerella sp.]
MRKLKITELNRLTPTEYAASNKTPLTVVLDHVRSLNNVGSVFRTADAFRVEEVCLCGITATPPNVEIHKTALGAEETVSWRYFKDTIDAVTELKQRQYTVIAIEQTIGSVSLNDFQPVAGQRYAVVFGHEVKGVAQYVVDACDFSIEIPQYGTKHSLNVSVAAGIIIREFQHKLTNINI